MDNDRFNQIGFIKLKSRFKSYKHRESRLNFKISAIFQNNQPVDLKLGCNGFHRNCLLRKIRYKEKINMMLINMFVQFANKIVFKKIKTISQKIDHLTDIQLSTYQYCDQCHQLGFIRLC